MVVNDVIVSETPLVNKILDYFQIVILITVHCKYLSQTHAFYNLVGAFEVSQSPYITYLTH